MPGGAAAPESSSRGTSETIVFGCAVLVVWATVPLARAVTSSLRDQFGEGIFIAIAGVGILSAICVAWRVLRGQGPRRTIAVGVTAAALGGAAFTLRAQPIEALHLLQYGGLGWLGWRVTRVRDASALAFLSAALLGAGVGVIDEAIQWATPGRVWDLRDIGINAFAATAAQLPFAVGGDGARRKAPESRGLAQCCGMAAFAAGALTLSLAATPDRLSGASRTFPFLAWTLDHPDVMLEYGSLLTLPDGTRFRSRFAAEELAAIDAGRAAEAGARLASGSSEAAYADFLAHYTVTRDPFLHEARVHLFRRDRYLLTADRHLDDPPWRARDLAVALAEDAILEAAYGRTLEAAGLRLDPNNRAEWRALVDPNTPAYESPVSRHLVTDRSEWQVLAAPGIVTLSGLVGLFVFGRSSRTSDEDVA